MPPKSWRRLRGRWGGAASRIPALIRTNRWARDMDELPIGRDRRRRVQVSVVHEDVRESVAVDGLVCVGDWIAGVTEPVPAEPPSEFGGDARPLASVQGAVTIGGQPSPARVALHRGPAQR